MASVLQNWSDSNEQMPDLSGGHRENEGGEQGIGKRGLGSYAAKLELARQQGLGSDPDQVGVS